MTRSSLQSRQSGFTLIEVLVSVVILAIGLLGLAGLQSTGLRATGGAYMLTQATMLANDMADRMRANMPGVGIGGTGSYDSLTVSASTSPCDPATTNCPPTTCYDTACGTAAAAATADTILWADALAALPSGQGTVTRIGTTNRFTITVSWDNNRSGAIDTNHSIEVAL